MANAYDEVYPRELRTRELDAITERRKKLDPTIPAPGPADDNRIGLALSGGGIRSATFCLGVLQSLSKSSLLRRVDFLSTVSGGGFCGAMLGGMFQRAPKLAPASSAERPDQYVTDELSDLNSRTIRWLRENGRYLTPEGAGDGLVWAASIVRNWVALQTVLGGAVLGVFTVLWLGRGLLQRWPSYLQHVEWIGLPSPGAYAIWWSPLWPLVLVVVAFVVVPLGWGYWLTQRASWAASLLGVILVLGAAAWVLAAPTGLRPDPTWRPAAWVTGGLALLAIIWWALGSFLVSMSSTGTAESQAQSRRRAAMLALLAASVSLATPILFYAWTGAVVDWIPAATPLVVFLTARRLSVEQACDAAESWRQQVRYRLTKWLAGGIASAGTLGLLVIGDTAVQTIYVHLRDLIGRSATAGGIGASGLAVIGQRIWKWIKGRSPSGRRGIPTIMLAWIGAGGLAILFFVMLSAVTVGVALKWEKPPCAPRSANAPAADSPALCAAVDGKGRPLPVDLKGLGLVSLVFIVFGLCARRIFGFLNLSSQQQMYAARLTRAYLGVSNPQRTMRGSSKPPSRSVDGDDIPFREYRPDQFGGPLHLVNVTINETLSGESQVEQRDRKGLGLAIGPCGVSAGARHHAVWDKDMPNKLKSVGPAGGFRVWATSRPGQSVGADSPGLPGELPEPEALSLGRWIGISGAAFTTGSGQHTSLATSLLCGLLNIRLGYWWDSGIEPSHRAGRTEPRGWAILSEKLDAAFPVQSALFDELFGRFHGPARRHWYLSDGGHFENSAAYELIRRRVPLIVVCDCGRDIHGALEDLAGLVRKARIDLGAEVKFFDEGGLATLPGQLGTIKDGWRPIGKQSELRRAEPGKGGPRLSCCHASMAWIDYPHDTGFPRSLLLVLKPTLTGDEPLDLLQYAEALQDFPQQSTADQFFDEAQWEGYRALGEHVASHTINGNLIDFLLEESKKQRSKEAPA